MHDGYPAEKLKDNREKSCSFLFSIDSTVFIALGGIGQLGFMQIFKDTAQKVALTLILIYLWLTHLVPFYVLLCLTACKEALFYSALCPTGTVHSMHPCGLSSSTSNLLSPAGVSSLFLLCVCRLVSSC